ncbi:hypothetical protein F4782DRAFT_140786 [Xylaria castorea]|nr:hypothetical protein F4782DRAFT_140786 [Xylaria castorea]
MSVDSLEGALMREVKPGRRGPERRANKLSFLEEITAEQMCTYSPVQIATILQQRENLLSVLSQQHQASGGAHDLYHPSGSYDGRQLKSPPSSGHPADVKSWVPRTEECQAKYCHRCRPSFVGRTFLSLDGIANGDIPPTAATSFGFRQRPVADARVVRNIGLRAVPLPRRRDQPHTDTSSQTSLSSLDPFDIVGDVPDYQEMEVEVEAGSTRDSTPPTPSDSEATSFGDLLNYEKMEVELEEDSTCDSDPPTPSDFKARDFGDGPLEVEDDVAVLEENIEFGVSDIITQV